MSLEHQKEYDYRFKRETIDMPVSFTSSLLFISLSLMWLLLAFSINLVGVYKTIPAMKISGCMLDLMMLLDFKFLATFYV